MKIFNWIFSSFCRTFGRFLFYIVVGFLAYFAISGFKEVNAATYTTESNQITATFDNTAYNRSNMVSGKTYYHGDKISSSTGFNSYTEIIISDTEDHIDGIFPGTYLIDFYVYGDGTITQNLSCDNINSNFGYYDTTTGNLVTSSSKISSKCLEVYNSKYNTVNAVKVLMQFTFNGDFAHELKLVITNNSYFIRNTNYFGVFIGNIYDYDQSIVELFHQNALADMQINQNQTIIDQNDQTNNKLDDLNDNLTSTDNPDLGALENSAGWLAAGPVDSILNLPFSLLNNLTSNLSKRCQPVILPIPYINKDLTLPCVNTLYEDMGVSVWANTIGTIASAFIMFSYLLKLYRWVDDTLSFRENNQIDNWGGI